MYQIFSFSPFSSFPIDSAVSNVCWWGHMTIIPQTYEPKIPFFVFKT